MRSDKLSSDQTDSEWNCVWDSQTDLYTFTNNFDVKTGQSLSGGFELLWSLNARECESGYTRTESPTFTVKDAGSISLEPLSYRFTSEKDRYRIFLERNALSGEEHERSDKNYIWYDFQTRFDSDYLSRGLYKSDYFFSIELPDGVDDSAVIAKMGNKTVTLSRNENGVLGFYPFKNKSGNLTTQNASYYETVTLGFKRESLDGKEITINGHLDRLYQDEDEWVREAGENECVDATCTFLVSGYGFRYDGYSYGSGKYNKEYERGYKNNNINDHGEPDAYSDRLPVTGLYNGKVVEFVLHGSAKRSYAENQAARSAKSVRRIMITDEEEQDEILLETVAESSENLEHADDAEQSEAGETLPETAEPQETAETRLGSTIYVHVCGHVKYPGVYQMQEGSRVYEAIDKAGGMLEEGAGDAMNMAAVLEDGMRIMVPDLAQAAQMIEQGAVFDPGSSASVSDRKSSGKVDLNRADVKELMTLTGIGQSRAEAIIRYREEIGSFERIEDVMKVSGIKESAFNKIKDDITV